MAEQVQSKLKGKLGYERNEMIALCDQAVVPVDKWMDRDSCKAHQQIGQLRMLLKAGCNFEIMTKYTEKDSQMPEMCTSKNTIWVRVFGPDFKWVEMHGIDDVPEDYNKHEIDTFYLPTYSKVKAADGEDWY